MKRLQNKGKAWWILLCLPGMMLIQSRQVLADVIDTGGGMGFSGAPGASWMEVAVLIMVGLAVIFAVFAIFFIYRQKKRDEKDERLRKEAEREEHE